MRINQTLGNKSCRRHELPQPSTKPTASTQPSESPKRILLHGRSPDLSQKYPHCRAAQKRGERGEMHRENIAEGDQEFATPASAVWPQGSMKICLELVFLQRARAKTSRDSIYPAAALRGVIFTRAPGALLRDGLLGAMRHSGYILDF